MLTKRLTKLVEAIPQCGTLADVGCDHGYIGIEALQRHLACKVVFVDISPACLQKARTNCPTALRGQAEFVCQDGLGQIECDTAVICGMGGLEILSILNSCQRLPNTVVLQPMRNIVDTRNFVAQHYTITLDKTIADGKYYTVIVGENVGTPTRHMSELEREFGLTNMTNPSDDFVSFLNNEHNKLQQILLNCASCEVNEKLNQVDRALAIALSK